MGKRRDSKCASCTNLNTLAEKRLSVKKKRQIPNKGYLPVSIQGSCLNITIRINTPNITRLARGVTIGTSIERVSAYQFFQPAIYPAPLLLHTLTRLMSPRIRTISGIRNATLTTRHCRRWWRWAQDT